MNRRLRIGSASVVGSLCVAVGVGCSRPRSGATRPQATVCSGHGGPGASRIWLEAAPSPPGDTLWTVGVCLRPADGTRVGSFHLAMEYDPSVLDAVRIVGPSSGSVLGNLHRSGRADVAGADPHGFAPGMLVQVMFTRGGLGHRGGEPLSKMRLQVLELNAVSGASLLGHLSVAGLGASLDTSGPPAERRPASAAGEPHLDSIVPSHVPFMGPGELVRIVIHGSGFQGSGNVVLLAGTPIAELSSPAGHTLRLILPDHFPGQGEVAPRMITPGRYEIRIRTAAGTSNGRVFTVGTPR